MRKLSNILQYKKIDLNFKTIFYVDISFLYHFMRPTIKHYFFLKRLLFFNFVNLFSDKMSSLDTIPPDIIEWIISDNLVSL